ncbi:hypothetical protein N8I84_20205 [Streptomyces cynarae]|uniref:Secreted protein n=1 Tax=Streptomyces cynarae TaxID=2981134 RepID=A0ABY6E289_9ACTN|nr:hypothetical protein [Streptomyces cynarae]UXY20765.1 hypothetical protein N8I84_20205 [Streptomyces cynarae]
MLPATWLRGRRGLVVGASAVVVCLGGILAAGTGGADGEAYVAVGPAGGGPPASGTAVAPTGDVTLVPLDGPSGTGSAGNKTAGNKTPGTRSPGIPDSRTSAPTTAGDGPASGPTAVRETAGAAIETGTGTKSPAPGPVSPSPTPTIPRPTPSGPAVLTAGRPERQPTDHRWCENVTVLFRNSGGTPVRSGTVTLGTHIIGALGTDWATIESTEALPAPLAAEASVKGAWTVCVEAWRVPLGMHVETRDVTVRWT